MQHFTQSLLPAQVMKLRSVTSTEEEILQEQVRPISGHSRCYGEVTGNGNDTWLHKCQQLQQTKM